MSSKNQHITTNKSILAPHRRPTGNTNANSELYTRLQILLQRGSTAQLANPRERRQDFCSIHNVGYIRRSTEEHNFTTNPNPKPTSTSSRTLMRFTNCCLTNERTKKEREIYRSSPRRSKRLALTQVSQQPDVESTALRGY